VACFQHVYLRKHVNALFCALIGCVALALLTLTAEEPQVPLQQPAGGDVLPLKPIPVGSAYVGMLVQIWNSGNHDNGSRPRDSPMPRISS
jgi:hypothetical protein